ncbi:MAG: hypothetical protein GY861_15230 [bacterium]|nr:hypothetical protein [bacterium]
MKTILNAIAVMFSSFVILLIPAGIAGYVSNIVQLIGMESILDSTIGIMKLVGCFLPPIGAVLGMVGSF